MRMARSWVVGLILGAPGVQAAETGTVTGTLDSAPAGTTILAVDRASGKRQAGRLETESGRFVVEGLLLDTAYDVILDAPGQRLEGVDLAVPRSDYEEEQPLSDEDRAALTKVIRLLNKFEDEIEVLAIRGNIQHAAVLVNKLRTRPFVNSKPGEVVWRAEVWRFERPDETWIKVQEDLFTVLYRERLPRSEYVQKAITFDPALGGLRPTSARTRVDVGRVKLPPEEPGIRFRADFKPK